MEDMQITRKITVAGYSQAWEFPPDTYNVLDDEDCLDVVRQDLPNVIPDGARISWVDSHDANGNLVKVAQITPRAQTKG